MRASHAGSDLPVKMRHSSCHHNGLSSSTDSSDEHDGNGAVPVSPILASSLSSWRRNDLLEESLENQASSVPEKQLSKSFSFFSLFGWGGGAKAETIGLPEATSNSRADDASSSVQSSPDKKNRKQRRAFQKDWRRIHQEVRNQDYQLRPVLTCTLFVLYTQLSFSSSIREGPFQCRNAHAHPLCTR